jgi:hypothetical protein
VAGARYSGSQCSDVSYAFTPCGGEEREIKRVRVRERERESERARERERASEREREREWRGREGVSE